MPVWWAWVGFAYYADRFASDDGVHRAAVLIAMGAGAVMAIALPDALLGRADAFAAGYATTRLVLIALYIRAARAAPEAGPFTRLYGTPMAVGACVWLASLLLPPSAQLVSWAVASTIEIATPMLVNRSGRQLAVDVVHLTERFGTFVIIVLGGSVVTAGEEAAGQDLTASRVAVVVGAFVIAVGLWWGYFDKGAWRRRFAPLETDEGDGAAATRVCSYAHFPLVVGMSLVAVGVQLALDQAGRPDLEPAARWALCGGTALYFASLNAMAALVGLRAGEGLVVTRTVLGVVALALVLATPRPAVTLAALAVLLLAHAGAGVLRTAREPVQAQLRAGDGGAP